MRKRRRVGAGFGIAAVALVLSGCNQTLYSNDPSLPAYSAAAYADGIRPASVAPPGLVAPPAGASTNGHLLRDEAAKSGRGELDLRVDRVWAEQGYTFATVSIRNTSPYELEEITIRCTALGAGHVNLNFREQTLLTRHDGRMPSGFAKTMKIRLERGGFKVREMTCSARGW